MRKVPEAFEQTMTIKVRDLGRAAQFYREVLGPREVACSTFGGRMPPAKTISWGLYPVALRIGDTLEELRAAKALLAASGVGTLRFRAPRLGRLTRRARRPPRTPSSLSVRCLVAGLREPPGPHAGPGAPCRGAPTFGAKGRIAESDASRPV